MMYRAEQFIVEWASDVPSIAPEIVPASSRREPTTLPGARSADPNAAVLFADNHAGN
jgi:hypothetical protein